MFTLFVCCLEYVRTKKRQNKKKMSILGSLGLESRDHNYSETTSTTIEVFGKHSAEFKRFFESFISSDVSLKIYVFLK
jgi:hypothetical protein